MNKQVDWRIWLQKYKLISCFQPCRPRVRIAQHLKIKKLLRSRCTARCAKLWSLDILCGKQMFGHVPWVVVSVHRATHSLPEPLGKRRAGIIVLGEANAAEESVVGLETTSYQGSASGSGQKSAQYRSVPKFSKIAAGWQLTIPQQLLLTIQRHSKHWPYFRHHLLCAAPAKENNLSWYQPMNLGREAFHAHCTNSSLISTKMRFLCYILLRSNV